ncbi:hypothetical protein [Devosia psychrophila]|uniref:Uncharacterized protein n=1 Tax=Devosia psychrophila TaxID=728005 RepID=A0A0F5Q111_9HYPH|nr:hypothetical protein [Devosia psychrophila]KKC34602.1 hypothetical protein WH91_01760 [Devosia psychrophila]SFD00465.1 hypothetical protein SAMN04488059_11733 [Devosia psychrophila]
MVDVRMPDGVVVRFPDDMPDDQIRTMIAGKFPQVAQQQQAQALPTPMPQKIAPVPRPRPMLGMGPGSDQTFTIQAPDGRKIQIRAQDEATAVRGAKEGSADHGPNLR